MHAAPRREFYAKMDAANVDLKAFTEEFYLQLTGAHLAPVLDTLHYLRHETDCWLEITTLLIPGAQRQQCRDRRDDALDRRAARARRAAALHRVPSRLQDAGRAADAAGDADAGPRDRSRATVCTMSTPATCTTSKAARPSVPRATKPWCGATGMRCCPAGSRHAATRTASARIAARRLRDASGRSRAASGGGGFQCVWRCIDPFPPDRRR